MSEVVFTMPGKAGDAIHQFPIAYHYARLKGTKVTLWLDERSGKMVAPLFAAQPCVEKVEFKSGVENYNCGGQPWHFDLPSSEYEGRNVYHLGYRSFPQRQLTLESLSQSKVPIDIPLAELTELSPFAEGRARKDAVNRLVLHGTGVCAHNRRTPDFWKFLASVRHELEMLFDEIVFVGSDDDIAVGRQTYPEWGEFRDDGDFRALAAYMGQSRAFIGCGSAPAALAQWLKVPCVRVHDAIGDAPKVVWEGLGDKQINDSEIGLRSTWAPFRDRWLSSLMLGSEMDEELGAGSSDA